MMFVSDFMTANSLKMMIAKLDEIVTDAKFNLNDPFHYIITYFLRVENTCEYVKFLYSFQ